MSDDMMKRWHDSGLLEGLTVDFEVKCAQSLETAMNLLINDTIPKNYAGVIFPMVRKVYSTRVKDNMPDIEWLCRDFIQFFNGYVSENRTADINVEAHAVDAYVQQLENKAP
jgi:hypothetical protein